MKVKQKLVTVSHLHNLIQLKNFSAEKFLIQPDALPDFGEVLCIHWLAPVTETPMLTSRK